MKSMTDDNRTDRLLRRRHNANQSGKCDYCRPHSGENAKRHHFNHGKTKPRYKQHR